LFIFEGITKQITQEEIKEKLFSLECMVANSQLCLGKSLLYFKNLSYLKAPFYLRKSWRWIDRSNALAIQLESFGVKLSGEFKGLIAFGMGFFHFVISLLPPYFQWFAQFLSFMGDREKSYVELKYSL
jgi:hypothetical protein